MLRTRVIPVLLLRNESLVKTVRFRSFNYIGDPCNTVRIFNELEVDELLFLDIAATRELREPNYNLLADIANECFMPLGYGGGIKSLVHAKKIFDIGFEKIALNTNAIETPALISEIAKEYGNQSVMVSIDVKTEIWGKPTVWTLAGTKNTRREPVEWAQEAESLGAGEILLTSVDREGTWSGFDIDLTRRVADAVSIPVIAHGGGGTISDVGQVVKLANASAVALGSMVVYQRKGLGVLVNFPNKEEIEKCLVPYNT